MSERRFVIKEVRADSSYWASHPDSITESELKQRLEAISKKYAIQGGWSLDVVIDILLHGDSKQPTDCPEMRKGEKGEVHDHIPLRGLSIEEIMRKYPKEYAEVITEAEDNQPSPAPTREEWEVWAHQLSHKLITKIYASHIAQRADVKDSLLSMPIVPKE